MFRDYYELIEPLALPIRGSTYEIPPAAASDVVRWRLFQSKIEARAKLTEAELITDDDYQRMFLGAALETMRADGLHPAIIEHAATTAMVDAMAGRDAAEKVWNSISPKASKPERPKRPATAKGSKRSPSTGAANTTPSPARTSGTRPRQK